MSTYTLRHKGRQVLPGIKMSPIDRALQDPATRPLREFQVAYTFSADLRARYEIWEKLASEIIIHPEAQHDK